MNKNLFLPFLVIFFYQGCFFSSKWYENNRYETFKIGNSRADIISNIGVPTRSKIFDDGTVRDTFYFREIHDKEFKVKFLTANPSGIFTVREPKMEFHYINVDYNENGIIKNVEFSEDD